MARAFFKTLSDYLLSSQQEWKSSVRSEQSELELRRQAEYEEGLLAMQNGDFEEAVDHFKKATDSRRYRKDAYYCLADCYQHLNMLPLARRTYERLMRLDYNFEDVQEKIRVLDAPRSRNQASLQSFQTQQSPPQTTTVSEHFAPEDRYEILKTLHKGQYSRVFQVRDRLLGRLVALKQIDRQYPDRLVYLQQMKERTAVAHPNILQIYDIDEKLGQISMAYVEGQDLRQTLRVKGALAPKMALHIAVQIVNGLHQAHSHGIIHHALTPEHLLLNRRCHLKMTAFRAPDSFMRLQKNDEPYKYLYIPPEIFQGQTLQISSNVYSLGVILYEMLLGKTPFRLRQIKAFVNKQQALEFDESGLPPGIEPLIRRCLTLNEGERYPNIRAVGEALIAWYKGFQGHEAHGQDIVTYKDYLLMAWADGKITQQEADFLAHKRRELHISEEEARNAEVEVKQELEELLKNV